MNSILLLCVAAFVSVTLALPARDSTKDRLEYVDLLKTELKEFVEVKRHEFMEITAELSVNYDVEPAWIHHVDDMIKQFIFTLNYREITRDHILIAREIQKEIMFMKNGMAPDMTEEEPLFRRARQLVRDFDFIAAHIDYISHLLNEN